jgi:hypothetical protein
VSLVSFKKNLRIDKEFISLSFFYHNNNFPEPTYKSFSLLSLSHGQKYHLERPHKS